MKARLPGVLIRDLGSGLLTTSLDPALCVADFNPVIRRFAQRLAGAAKLNKVIIVACMRKLLSTLNAMIREGITWDQLKLVKNAWYQTQPLRGLCA